MGDCRIRIQISKSIVVSTIINTPPSVTDHSDVNVVHDFITITKVYSADTTIDEIFESTICDVELSKTNQTLRSLINSDIVSVWDCTTHPSIDITQQCRYNRTTYCIQTLYTNGWFPSGCIQILPQHATHAISVSSESYDDIQYSNSKNRTNSRISSNRVHILDPSLSHGGTILPSQLLHSVTQRFNMNDDESSYKTPEEALRIRQEYDRTKQMALQLRHQKLDARIQRLSTSHNNNNNQGVSDQVRKMLIKSRATGLRNTTVQIQDRVYLHCILWYDHNENKVDLNSTQNPSPSSTTAKTSNSDETYIYVSIQDTIGRVVDTFVPNRSHPQETLLAKEMLWIRTTSTPPEQINEYQRFPSTLRFYEAIEQQWISKDNINTVIIRFFNPNEQDATPTTSLENSQKPLIQLEECNNSSILSPSTIDSDINTIPPTSMDGADDANKLEVTTHETITLSDSTTISIPLVTGNVYDQLWDTISGLVVHTTNMDAKKISAKEKVRQMQMKSKAIGDTKRIKQKEHRLYLQLITTHYNQSTNTIQIIGNIPVFVSRHDVVQRIVDEQSASKTLPNDGSMFWELLVLADATNDCNDNNHTSTTNSKHTFRQVASSNNENLTKLTWNDLILHEKVNGFGNLFLQYFSA